MRQKVLQLRLRQDAVVLSTNSKSALHFCAGKIIGCELDGQSVTLEPGGQFELSGAPVSTLHQTCAEVNQHLYQVRQQSDFETTSMLDTILQI